jgi:superfamily II DNA or RNA helicase
VSASKDFISTELALAINSQISPSEIYRIWHQYAQNRKTIVFAASVGHSKTLAEAFKKQGISAEHLDGDTAASQRFAILKNLKKAQSKFSVIIKFSPKDMIAQVLKPFCVCVLLKV